MRQKKLATMVVDTEGRRIYTLGPIHALEPIDRLLWAVLYQRLGWRWVYTYLWRKYAR